MSTAYVMQIFRTPDNRPTPFDGQYVVEYDPTRAGDNPLGVHLVCTDDLSKARRFDSLGQAHAYWRTESGRPAPADRPLTAYNVIIEQVPQ